MAEVKLITMAEYARSRKARGLSGGTPAAVLKAVNTGRITAIDGKIDPTVADIQWDSNTRPRADYHAGNQAGEVMHGELITAAMGGERPEQPPATESRGSEFWEAATREKVANAKLKEFEVEVQAGRLIDRAGYERAAFTTARMLRDALVLTFPAKYAARLAPISDPWELEQRLRQFLREELAALSRSPVQDAPSEDRHAASA